MAFTITLNNVNCSFENTSTSIEEGASYTNKITPDAYYYLELSNITVEMGGEDITSASVTMYDSYATISIASVTGNLIITSSATPVSFPVNIIADNCIMTNSATSVEYGSTYTNTIVPTEGYLFIPNSVYALSGSTALSITVTPVNIQITTTVTNSITICAVGVRASGVFSISDIKFSNPGSLSTTAKAYSENYIESESSNSQILNITKLATPTNLSISEDKVLSWDTVANAYGYEVRRVSGSTSVLVAEVYNNQLNLSAYYTSIGSYTLYVLALGKGAYVTSNKSENIVYTISSIPLDAPINLSVSNDTLSWDAVSNAYSYRVYYNRTSSPTISETLLTTTTSTSCSLSALPYGTIELRVQARPQNYQTYGDSPKSNAYEYVIASTPLSAPTNLAITNKTLSWTASQPTSAVSSYAVTLSTGQTVSSSSTSVGLGTYVTTEGSLTITVKGYAKSVSRYVTSDSSDPLTITVDRLTAPSLSVDVNGLVTWSTIPNASSYIVYYRVGSSSIQSYNTTSTSFNIIDHLSAGAGTYSVYVIANSTSLYHLNSNVSNTVTYNVESVMLDAPVISLSGSTVSWNTISHATGYLVYINNTQVTTPYITTTSYNVETYLYDKPAGTYDIFVKAHGTGIYRPSQASNTETYTVSPVQLSVPANPTVSVNTFSWSAVSHAASSNGYRIKITGDYSYERLVSSTSVDLHSYIPRDAGTYYLQVKAVSWGRYIESDYTTAQTYILTPLGTPTDVQIDGTTLSLTSVPNAYGYKLYNGTTPLSSSATDFTGTSYNLANLITTADTYNIRVRAIASTSTVYVNSELSSGVSYVVTKLATPTLTITDAVLSWTAIEHAVSYKIYKNGATTAWKTVTDTSFDLVNEITDSGTYTFTVAAYNTGLYVISDKSNSVSYSITNKLDTPTNLHVTGRELSWNSVTNATRYEVYCTYTSDSSVTVFSVSTTTVNLSTYLLQLGTYKIKVRAKAAGYVPSNYTSEITFTMTPVPLNTPQVTLVGTTLSWDVIANAAGYRVYDNNTSLFTTNNTSVDLLDYLSAGTYSLNVVAIGSGTYSDSAHSNSVSISLYSVTYNLTNCTSSNTDTMVIGSTSYASTITPTQGYIVTPPYGSVSITMGGVDITSTAYSNLEIAIASVTGNLVITIVANIIPIPDAPVIGMADDVTLYIDEVTYGDRYIIYNNSGDVAIAAVYPMHITVVNCTQDSSNNNCIVVPSGSSVTEQLTFIANTGYEFTSESVTVSGASQYAWDYTTGILSVDPDIGAVEIQVVATAST